MSTLFFANAFIKLATIAILHFPRTLNDLFRMITESEANSLSATCKFSPPCNTRDSYARSIIIPRFPFRANSFLANPSSPDMSKTTITRVRGLAFEASSRFHGVSIWRYIDVVVKGRNVPGIAQVFVVENRSTFYVSTYQPKEGRRSSLAGLFRAIYPAEIDSTETKGVSLSRALGGGGGES